MTDPASPEIAMAALAKLHHVMGHDLYMSIPAKYTSVNSSNTVIGLSGIFPGVTGMNNSWYSGYNQGLLSDLTRDSSKRLSTIGEKKTILYDFMNWLPPTDIAIGALNGDKAAIASVARQTVRLDSKQNTDFLSLDAPDTAMRARFEAAFLHAADLCRAQDAALRQAETAKTAKRPDEAF